MVIAPQRHKSVEKSSGKAGFTLVELLVVISIIALLTGILLPALSRAKGRARTVLGMNNQRQIIGAVGYYALDNDETYPESVATLGFGDYWNWQEPTMLVGYLKRSPGLHRSNGAYLGVYIRDGSIMYCPNAPKQYKYLQEAWESGDDWDNPETPPVPDPLIGTYCFYWNYVGCLGGEAGLFRGPRGPSGGGGQSTLLVSDYFGYDHWRSPRCVGSCEKFGGAGVTEGTSVSSAYWSARASGGAAALDSLRVALHAGYADGHVGGYGPAEVVPMKVSLSSDGRVPYPDGVGPGVFYLPREAVR